MKRSILLSTAIISAFFLCHHTMDILSYLNIDYPRGTQRGNIRWGINLLIVLITSAALYSRKNMLSSLGLSKGMFTGMSYGFLFTLPMIIGYTVIGEIQPDRLFITSMLTIFFWAAMEEVLFRGFLFGQLFQKANWGFIPAVLLNAVIFGMGHLYQGSNFEHSAAVFGITLIGAVWFSWIYIEWESNLWVAIGLHFFMNFSWNIFAVGETALGGWGANLFRIMTIVLSIVITIIYRQHKGYSRVNKNNLFYNNKNTKTKEPRIPNAIGHQFAS